MDIYRNRTFLKACVASLALLIAGGVSAQTIYKQVDDEGRVTFTDRPNPTARVVTSYETRGPASAGAADASPRYDAPRIAPMRRPVQDEAADPVARYPASGAGPAEPRVIVETTNPRTAVSSSGATRMVPPVNSPMSAAPATASEPLAMANGAAATRSNYGEVERAVATYQPLNTPLAVQADVTEAARRARQEATKGPAAPILVVQAAPREHEAVQKSGVGTFYYIWVVTFFLLAAGLLYVGWQVFRLILGTAFPRFHIGAA